MRNLGFELVLLPLRIAAALLCWLEERVTAAWQARSVRRTRAQQMSEDGHAEHE